MHTYTKCTLAGVALGLALAGLALITTDLYHTNQAHRTACERAATFYDIDTYYTDGGCFTVTPSGTVKAINHRDLITN